MHFMMLVAASFWPAVSGMTSGEQLTAYLEAVDNGAPLRQTVGLTVDMPFADVPTLDASATNADVSRALWVQHPAHNSRQVLGFMRGYPGTSTIVKALLHTEDLAAMLSGYEWLIDVKSASKHWPVDKAKRSRTACTLGCRRHKDEQRAPTARLTAAPPGPPRTPRQHTPRSRAPTHSPRAPWRTSMQSSVTI